MSTTLTLATTQLAEQKFIVQDHFSLSAQYVVLRANVIELSFTSVLQHYLIILFYNNLNNFISTTLPLAITQLAAWGLYIIFNDKRFTFICYKFFSVRIIKIPLNLNISLREINQNTTP